MRCNGCGSEKGFQGKQPGKMKIPGDPFSWEATGPEKIFCESCGAEVDPDAPEVLVGVPEHLREKMESDAEDGIAGLLSNEDVDPA